MPAVTRLRWLGGETFEPTEDPGEVRIIDSWLAADSRMRAFDAHARRFAASAQQLNLLDKAQGFMRAVPTVIPAAGRWFPRAELTAADGGYAFQLWLRPAPPRMHGIRLWTAPEPDRRTCPRVKGPDLGYLNELRQAAVAAGADEAVLLSSAGHVLEGSTTSLLWWRAGTLCAPPPQAPVLPGITRSLLLARATSVAFENVTPADLAGLEVWAVNALYGIRPVTAWLI